MSALQGSVQAPATGLQVPNDRGQSASVKHSTHRWAEGSQIVRNSSVQVAFVRQPTHCAVVRSQTGDSGEGHSLSDLQPRQVSVVESQMGVGDGQVEPAEQLVIFGVMASATRSPQEGCQSHALAASSPSSIARGPFEMDVAIGTALILMGASRVVRRPAGGARLRR